MPIIEINIAAVEPFAEGKTFGQAGGYVRVRGVARGVLDPRAPENAGIVDLDKATRNKAGEVEYATDFFILRPAEPRRGSGMLVYDVTNRGSKRILQLIDDVPANDPIAVNDPKTARDAGLGFPSGAAIRSCGRAGTPARRAPITGSAPISRLHSIMVSRSPAAFATSSRPGRAVRPNWLSGG